MNPEENAAAQAFLAQHAFVRAVANRAAPWPGLADDITQQVFLEYIRKSARWDLTKDLRPLLATMTRMVALRHLREAVRQESPAVQKLAEHIRSLAESSLSEENSEATGGEALQACLRQLPERSRSLVDMHYFSGLSTREIGERIETNPDTVCRALSRVRDALRRCLKKSNIESSFFHG